MKQNEKPENVVEIATEHDESLATKADVEIMITKRLMEFHAALVDRGQIYPISPDPRKRVSL